MLQLKFGGRDAETLASRFNVRIFDPFDFIWYTFTIQSVSDEKLEILRWRIDKWAWQDNGRSPSLPNVRRPSLVLCGISGDIVKCDDTVRHINVLCLEYSRIDRS